jgi:putative ABC transport system permease protein
VALRKMLGASRAQLISQFLGESLFYVLIATLLALAAVEVTLPYVSSLIGADLTLTYVGPESVLPAIAGLVAVVALAAGLYPAFYLTRFQPARVLKANASASDPPGTGRLRAALVVGQFAVSIGLIACTAIVYSQTIYARTVDPGFRRDGLIQVSGLRELGPVAEAFTREAARIEGVAAVSRTMIGVSTDMISMMAVELPGQRKPIELGNYSVDPSFFGAMGIDLIAGRLFDARIPADEVPTLPQSGATDQPAREDARLTRVVVNESAARSLGYRAPASAVGKSFRNGAPGGGDASANLIIGVVRDSRFRSVREEMEPIVFRYDRANLPYAVIRYKAGDLPRVRKELESVWKRFAPEVPFEAELSEEVLGRLYKAEEARGQLFGGFALLAVLIACLGLFGLAAFTAERRTKEIGVRKVFGARARDIVRLLAWQFSKPVILANLIAWPAAWWLMREWLNGFDTRIALTPGPFLLAGLIALAIAVGTIAGHAIRVARANPIHALRYE